MKTAKLAAINFLPANTDERFNEAGWGVVVDTLATGGVQTVISRGTRGFNVENGTFDGYNVERNTAGLYMARKIGEGAMPLADVGVVLDRAGPIKKELEAPILNKHGIRVTGSDKLTANIVALHDMQQRTHEIDDSFPSVIHDLPGSLIVVKPRRTLEHSGGVAVMDKDSAIEWFKLLERDETDPGWVVQEKLDIHPAPVEIKGMDEAEQAKLDAARDGNRLMELRLYCHYSEGMQTDFFPVMRIGNENAEIIRDEEAWAYVDPLTVPEDVVVRSWTALSRLADYQNVRDVFSAVDWVYADSDERRDWFVMEANVRTPYLPEMDENAEAATAMRKGLARQMLHIVQRDGQGQEV